MDLLTSYERVVRPDLCVAKDCVLLRYMWKGGREYMRCSAGVWALDIDVQRFDEIVQRFGSFGGVAIAGPILVDCPTFDQKDLEE